jgi:multiple sugar transport system ATP-binding protein
VAELRFKGLKKSFGKITALDKIDLEVKDREFFVLLGPTGAGKTTTLRIIAGLEQPEEGEVFLGNEVVNKLSPAERDVAMVFQYYTLYPHMNVRENLEFPLRAKMRNIPEDEIKNRVQSVARILKIEDKLGNKSTELSGGEMQRVGIGRALVRNPRLFLMDEPLSNLDAKLREKMRSELARIHIDLKKTFIYVTHDQIEAMTLADRIGILNEGVLLQIGTPDEIYNEPANSFVASFVGSPQINLIEAKVEGKNLFFSELGIKYELLKSQQKQVKGREKVICGIRPEDMIIVNNNEMEDILEVEVYFKESMGAEDILNLKCGSGMLKAIVPPHLKITQGAKVKMKIEKERIHLFDIDTKKRIT